MPNTLSASLRPIYHARLLTTLLCCVWGYTFAYTFFQCVLDNASPLTMLAAALPLAAVWAALERKRWGRLVLIVLSLLAHGLFAMMLMSLAFSNQVPLAPSERHLFGYITHAVSLFGDTPGATLSILLLSGFTAVWLCLPWVRDEFEKQKHVDLTPGQRVIAASVVILWSVTMVATPTVLESRSPNLPLRTPRRLTLRY